MHSNKMRSSSCCRLMGSSADICSSRNRRTTKKSRKWRSRTTRVREYQLRYTVGFRVTDVKGQVYVPTSQIRLTRDISFNDAQVLAKEAEEAQLYRDMQSDMVQQLLRRIAAAQSAKPAID